MTIGNHVLVKCILLTSLYIFIEI